MFSPDAETAWRGGGNAGTAASANDAASGNTEVQTSNYLSQEFVNYLNQQRAAAGLSQITWNSGLESLALTRAQEISENFSHPAYMQAPEIIQATDSSIPAEWYNGWYESLGHKLVMIDTNLSDGACGVYQVGDYYYVVFVCSYAPTTPDQIQDKMDSGEMQVIDTFTTDDGKEAEIWGTDGTGVLTDEDKQTDDWSWVNDLEWFFHRENFAGHMLWRFGISSSPGQHLYSPSGVPRLFFEGLTKEIFFLIMYLSEIS